ncbi:hypothetical protein Q7C36_022011 [Tachysurus vachellii]|uniref:Uncharacterized protein n=1 Tax=Tachysurus vachellii TaxID=175792 RepID=A0AA88LI49_TACVA|nr:hypothetical protein Q7C36_022011 [Tachysurus vachellii]
MNNCRIWITYRIVFFLVIVFILVLLIMMCDLSYPYFYACFRTLCKRRAGRNRGPLLPTASLYIASQASPASHRTTFVRRTSPPKSDPSDFSTLSPPPYPGLMDAAVPPVLERTARK